MSPFKIQPHSRLQEWVAEDKGYFRDEGLDYTFQWSGGTADAMGVGRSYHIIGNAGVQSTEDAPVAADAIGGPVSDSAHLCALSGSKYLPERTRRNAEE